MKFTKMHGAGNDYVYVDGFREKVRNPAKVAVAISHRHFGVGSDGLILIHPSKVADVRMEMYNNDGSLSRMCGNGVRCIAKYAYDHGLTRKKTVSVETLGGIKHVVLKFTRGEVTHARVDMGAPQPLGDLCRLRGRDAAKRFHVEPLRLAGRTHRVHCVSMGNPHGVIFVPNVAKFPIEKTGPLAEHHRFFPHRCNIEFVEVVSRREVRQRTWERGSGETWACGSGASAVAVACATTGRTGRRVKVHLLGGTLDIEWAPDDHIYMTGPAEEVCSGEWPG